jgi:hypothetical protein
MVSPAVASALDERGADLTEGNNADAERRHRSPLSVDSDGALLHRRASGVPVGEEFAITRELRRRLNKAIDGA